MPPTIYYRWLFVWHLRDFDFAFAGGTPKCVAVLELFICCNPDQPHHTFAVGANRALCQSIGKVNCPKRHSKYLLEQA